MKMFCVSLLALTMSVAAFANDYRAQYDAAYSDFERRGENAAFAASCATKAQAAFGAATNDVEKFDALVLESRCRYYVGMKAKSDSEKVRVFGGAKSVAEKAKNIQPNRAEGYYYYGISLARWAEANGIMKSLGERHNLRRNMETVLTKTAVVEGKTIPGAELDGYGANRTLGRMYFKLPGMFGGDNRKAEQLLRDAVNKMSPDYLNSLNVVYFAEVLIANGKKVEARRILDETLVYENEPAKYNPKRVPETADDMKELRAIRKELD